MKQRPSDRSGRVLRVLLGALLVATCIRAWLGPVTWVPRAEAQIPDAGSQRVALLEESRRTNELLSQILKTLQSQTLKVQMAGTDNTKAPPMKQRGGRTE